MRKALVISFFKSSNLGDIALSEAIKTLIQQQEMHVICYDFPTVSYMDSDNILAHKNVKHKYSQTSITKTNRSSVFRPIKNCLGVLFGSGNVDKLIFYLRQVLSPTKWNELESNIRDSDVIVLAGGNMLMDNKGIGWPLIFQKYCKLAKRNKKDLHVLYIGAGPIIYKESKKMIRNSLYHAKKVSVRDPFSRELLQELFDDKMIIQTVDPVFSMATDLRNHRNTQLNKLFDHKFIRVGICVLSEMCFNSKDEYDSYIAAVFKLICELSILSKNKIEYVLFSTEVEDYSSVIELKEGLESNNIKSVKIAYMYSVDDVIKLYKELNFLIGGRMHSLIFSQNCLLPFIGIVWQDKVKGFGKVTKSNTRIFELHELSSNISKIAENIVGYIHNKELITEMYSINKDLEEMVRKGNIDYGLDIIKN